ncbi:related to ARO8 - aromatic amino acid aminotransferase I [Cephalotrichum gorgonifer]|uniref:Related to ARO8 - aromatic amino acid aminotransferase I n=1 Tax=Cephalotrichum gorgonifer TaxID=2041049 RepID=A0AAE8MPG3_9PEZI|nr:related to ARO8 - aromatic amino acid aminotransferase I [Cephalotrichum gorgonifer]
MEPYAARIKDVLERRAKAGRFAPGVAAYSDSDMFKKSPSPDLPKAKRWDDHFTEECKGRKQCVLKQAAKHLNTPGLISLGGGLPSPSYFPFSSLSLSVPTPPDFSSSATAGSSPLRTITIGKNDIAEGKGEYDLAVALNYGQVTGSAQMLRFVTEITEILFAPPYADWGCAQTTGSTGVLETAARMFTERARGDKVLMEEYTYSTAQETMEALGIEVVGVRMDGQGMVPGDLRGTLEGWDVGARGRKPHVLYTVPTGQNPTGATLTPERRREIYDICEEHDIFIIEDDPYYLLQMAPYPPASSPPPAETSSLPSYLSSLPGTFLGIDTSGRVLRLDSFSKVLAPGSRMGWVTASAQVIDRFLRHGESSQGPSGFSQAALHTLLDRTWGHEGFLAWLANLGGEYTGRRNVLLGACGEFLPGVATWDAPSAGMFLWIKLDHTKHPRLADGILAIEDEIFHSCIARGVLVARGSWFRAASDGSEPQALFFRATYAMAGADAIREATRRFGAAVRESFGIKEE